MTAADFHKGDNVRMSALGLARYARQNAVCCTAGTTGVVDREPSPTNIWANEIPIRKDGSRARQQKCFAYPAAYWEKVTQPTTGEILA